MPKKHLGPWGTTRENGNDIATMGASMKQRQGEMVGIINDKTRRKQKGLGFFHHFIVVLVNF